MRDKFRAPCQFMDFNRRSTSRQYGSDGCIDWSDDINAGLDTIWCDDCPLTKVYKEKYAEYVSRADFWVAAANAVTRQTSVNNDLDLIDTFRVGRVDRDSCPGSADRIPEPSGCDAVEETFIDRMGLTWTDAVALMGGHTLGKGDRDFSGHEGVWVDNFQEAMMFDKKYYEELYLNAWRPRPNNGKQDWTTGRGGVTR